MHTIAIDCGASFIKGALFVNDKIVKREHRQSPAVNKKDDILVATQISELVPLVESLIEDLATGIAEFKLCISNEMHGFILATHEGKPYTDYISWQKEYGNDIVEGSSSVQILSSSEFSSEILHSGMPLRGGLPSCNLLYLKRNHLLIKDNELYFYSLGDYLIRVLSGQEPICHPTNAAATGLYDLSVCNWNYKLISEVATPNILFPIVGTSAIEFVFKGHKVKCFPAIGDQQAALLGAGVEKESDLSFNLGTGAQVSRLIHEVKFSNDFQVRPYFNGLNLMTIPHLPSGRALNVFIRFFKDLLEPFNVEVSDEELWTILLEKEKYCDSTNLVCDLSFFQNPLTNRKVGSIENIGEYSLSVGCLMKSIFKQMGSNFTIIADSIYPDKDSIERIVFSGGVARRIQSIREEILKHYDPMVNIVVAEEETLSGLNIYGNNE